MGLLDIIKGIFAEGAPAEELAEAEAGTPALFERCLRALASSDTQQFISICSNQDAIVQVAKGGETWHLNIGSYPSSDHPDEKLESLGIALPAGTTLAEWNENVFAQYSVPASATEDLAAAIDNIFQRLHDGADGYVVSVTMEN